MDQPRISFNVKGKCEHCSISFAFFWGRETSHKNIRVDKSRVDTPSLVSFLAIFS